MAKIDELISELCPEGVEVRSMGSIGSFVRGQRFVKDDMRPEGQPCIHYGEVYTKYQLEASTAFSFLEPAQATRLRKAQSGDVVIVAAGETIEDIGKPVVWKGNGDVVIHDALYAFRSPLNPKFVAYFLRTDDFKTQARRLISSSKISAISIANFGKINIPNPPLEVQREIVSILDKFTQLEAELEAELEARRRQYAFYRESLLTFPEESGVLWSTLGEVSTRVSSGATPLAGSLEYYDTGTIPWLRTQEIRFVDIWDTDIRITEKALKETAVKWIPANCVIVAISGATAGRSAVNRIPLATNQHCCNFEIDPIQANYRYVFYWVRSQYEQIKELGQGARSDLNSGIIKSVRIPVPSLDEQERIVAVLDKFDALVNDLSVGLPAEIAARRLQYEYYRNKLLTFKRLETE